MAPGQCRFYCGTDEMNYLHQTVIYDPLYFSAVRDGMRKRSVRYTQGVGLAAALYTSVHLAVSNCMEEGVWVEPKIR